MSVRIDRAEVTTASETGATHRQHQRDCEDAVGWSGADGATVVATVAVADGHSDPRCVRSRVGAEFVVAAATALPPEHADADALAEALIEHWRRSVDEDLAEHPLDGADLDASADEGEHSDPAVRATLSEAWATNARIAYGATAALCRVSADAITVVRVGDGDIIAVGHDGDAYRLAAVERRADDVTESISHPQAQQLVRRVSIPADAAPALLILATDGFDNAYPSDESMLRAARELAAHRRESGQPIGAEVLSRWAREAADVSGDDATVAVVWIETER
jgi:serine/threonine protein phosphatase PrpC